MCSMQEFFYHAIRCGLMHNASMPSDFEFISDAAISYSPAGKLQLSQNLVHGFIIAVGAAPPNQGERIGDGYRMIINTVLLKIDALWGQRDKVAWLLEATR